MHPGWWILIVFASLVVILGVLCLFVYFPVVRNSNFVAGEHDGGFFARINGMIGAAYYGETHGASQITLTNKDRGNQYTQRNETLVAAYLEQTEFPLKPSGRPKTRWQKTIENLDPVRIGSLTIPLTFRYGKTLWGKHREIFPVKSGIPLKTIGEYTRRYIKFKKSIVNQADVWFQENINPDKYLVCVHYRGTDTSAHFPFKKSDPTLYWARVDSILLFHPDAELFVATDQLDFAEQTKSKYPTCKLYNSPRSDKNDGLHNEKGFDPHQLGESVIIDAILLSKGHHLIKGRSNVSEYSLFCNTEMECTVIFTEDNCWHKPAGDSSTFEKIKIR